MLGLVVIVATALLTNTVGPYNRLRTIVVLSHAPVGQRVFEGLRDRLAELGWRDGHTVRFVHPPPQPTPAALRAEAERVISSDTALVVTLTTPTALAIHDLVAARKVPLLLAASSDPVATGLVSGLHHPGQDITGVAFALQEPHRLEMLRRLIPNARTIWVPHDGSDPSPVAALARLRPAADKLGLTLLTTDIRGPAALAQALDALPHGIDAIFIPPDASLASNLKAIAAAASVRGLAVTVPHAEGVAQGALFSYGFDLYAVGWQAARLADQILSGIPAADLPIESADMELTLNLGIADHLDLPIPDDLLRHANIVGRPGE